MKDICKNCGAWRGLHKYDNDQCPKNGVEAQYPKKQEYQNTYYQEDDSDLIAALRTERAELISALKEYLADHTDTAKKYLTGNPDKCNCSTCFKARLALDKVKGE